MLATTEIRRGVVTITPYRAADARALQLTAHAQASIQNVPNLEHVWVQYETMGPAWTLRVDDEVAGCAGLMLMWPGRAHAWMLPSLRLTEFPRSTVMAIIGHLRESIAAHALIRVQCDVMADFKLGRKLVEWIGFVEEGPPMLRYGPNDEDYQRYVIVQPREAPHVA